MSMLRKNTRKQIKNSKSKSVLKKRDDSTKQKATVSKGLESLLRRPSQSALKKKLKTVQTESQSLFVGQPRISIFSTVKP